jgi:hypothetical protein
MFYAEIKERPDEGRIPEEAFAPYVECGKFVRGETVITGDSHPKLQRQAEIRYIFCALRQEAWRIQAMTLLIKTSRISGWSEICERMEGALLGYTDEENDAHCKSRFNRQTA